MAVVYTVNARNVTGNLVVIDGTFTSALGDGNAESLGPSVHGLQYINDVAIHLDRGGVGTLKPKISVSGGTVTWTVEDTQAYSGVWRVVGR